VEGSPIRLEQRKRREGLLAECPIGGGVVEGNSKAAGFSGRSRATAEEVQHDGEARGPIWWRERLPQRDDPTPSRSSRV